MKMNKLAIAVLLGAGCSVASAAPLLANAVAIAPISVTATSNLGDPYGAINTINQVGLTPHYISGVTAASEINSISAVNNPWHGVFGQRTGSLTFDLGASYTLDRVFLFWTNGGSTNNIADISIDVSSNSQFSTFVTAATFGTPSAQMNEVDFAHTATGEYVRLSWTSLQGSYPGLNEFVAGGVSAVPEPESYAMLLAGLGLMGFVARRRKQK